MQTADLQTRAWVSQTITSVSQTSASVSQTSTPVSQNSTSVRLFMLAISDGIGNTIYNLPVCSLQSAYVAHHVLISYESNIVFVFSSFHCYMICFTVMFK